MNTDHDLFTKALLEELAAATPSFWDQPWPLDHMPAAVAAYHKTKEQKRMARELEPKPTDATIILAGVHSCSLATFVLEVPWGELDSPRVQVAKAMALKVLDNWGIEIESPKPAPAPPAPVAQAPVLVWPPVDRIGRPLHTVLPDVYRENYYHVHENTVVDTNDRMTGQLILPASSLVLHDAYWNEEALQWRMRFSLPSLPPLERFWLNHCQVRPGDEIPKVIDAATQARSNDP